MRSSPAWSARWVSGAAVDGVDARRGRGSLSRAPVRSGAHCCRVSSGRSCCWPPARRCIWRSRWAGRACSARCCRSGRSPRWGRSVGSGIAALDLGLLGRFFPLIAALPQGRQWADHVAFGLSVGVVLRATRRAGRRRPQAAPRDDRAGTDERGGDSDVVAARQRVVLGAERGPVQRVTDRSAGFEQRPGVAGVADPARVLEQGFLGRAADHAAHVRAEQLDDQLHPPAVQRGQDEHLLLVVVEPAWHLDRALDDERPEHVGCCSSRAPTPSELLVSPSGAGAGRNPAAAGRLRRANSRQPRRGVAPARAAAARRTSTRCCAGARTRRRCWRRSARTRASTLDDLAVAAIARGERPATCRRARLRPAGGAHPGRAERRADGAGRRAVRPGLPRRRRRLARGIAARARGLGRRRRATRGCCSKRAPRSATRSSGPRTAPRTTRCRGATTSRVASALAAAGAVIERRHLEEADGPLAEWLEARLPR